MIKPPLKIALLYLVFGVLWITLSDHLLFIIFTPEEVQHLKMLQTYKGLFFILFTATLLFILIRRNSVHLVDRLREFKLLNKQLVEKSIELEKTEKQYSDLFSISPLPMWVFDMETLKFLAVNKAAIKHYGYTEEEFLNMTLRDIRMAKDVRSFEEILNFTIKYNQNSFHSNVRHVKKNGEIIDVDIKTDFIEHKGKRARLVLINDVTELLEVQRNLSLANDNIIKVEDLERERIAAEMHDGLIQHMVATKHILSMLPIDKSDPNSSKFYKMLTELIDNSIIECQRVIYDLRPKDLNESGLGYAINRIIKKYNVGNDFKVIADIDADIEESLSENVKFNLFRIFQENLNNTMKHSRATEAKIKIYLLEHTLYYEFSDNGIGITHDILQKDTSFFALKTRLSSIGGKFTVKTSESKGSSFKFMIPLVGNEKI